MARWEPGARERLRTAALDLFAEQGFGETSVPQITARAGLTTRTFFRHFADKREVLFEGEADAPAMASRMIDAAPDFDNPFDVAAAGLATVAESLFEGRADELRLRRAVIESDEGLRERELRKMSLLETAIREGFEARGVDPLTAAVTARLTTGVFAVSIERWLDSAGSSPLAEVVGETLAAFRAVAAG